MKRIAASLLLFSLMGCCPKEEIRKTEATPVPAQVAEATPEPTPVPQPVAAPVMKKMSYEVKSGDTLWGISDTVYGNNWYWPSLYDANRDQITNHDVIIPGQVITYDKAIAQDEKDTATKTAQDTKAL